ncbi:MAG: DUF5131 family protein [Rhodocyclaceae bacterium]|nr:MAG: DUF5131 family protein [Rhodocyclaceae bacterium]
MGENSKIAWTHHTFNPWWGCVKVSTECKHCYAETLAKRYGHDVWGVLAPRRAMSDAHWKTPLKWNAAAAETGIRARVFCASMADVFETHEDEAIEAWLNSQRARLARLIEATPWLDWLLLTKRADRIGHYCRVVMGWEGDVPANVWLGVTAGTQATASERVPELMRQGWLRNPAGIFVSCEPMLEPVDFTSLSDGRRRFDAFRGTTVSLATQPDAVAPDDTLEAELDRAIRYRPIDVVIVGGESGAKSRGFDLAWARDVQRQMAGTSCHFFFKQAGDAPCDSTMVQIGEPTRLRFAARSGTDIDEMPVDLRVQSWPPSRRIASASERAVAALRTFAGRHPEFGTLGRAIAGLELRTGRDLAEMTDDEVCAAVEGVMA